MTNGSQPRWLSDEEREAWIGLMAVLIRLPAALDRQLRCDAGMTHFDYQVMVILSGAPDHKMGMSELACTTGGSLPRLSQVVSRLEKAGWIERQPDPADGRSKLASLSDVGLDALAGAAPGHVEEVRSLVFDHLTGAQVTQLAQIANQILGSPGSAPDPRPPNLRKPSNEQQEEDSHA